jgi:hypothetical protein
MDAATAPAWRGLFNAPIAIGTPVQWWRKPRVAVTGTVVDTADDGRPVVAAQGLTDSGLRRYAVDPAQLEALAR